MNKKHLQQLAGALAIPGRSKLNKAGLIYAINQSAGALPQIDTLEVYIETRRRGKYIFIFRFVHEVVYTCEEALASAMPILEAKLNEHGIRDFKQLFVDTFDSNKCKVFLRDPDLGDFPNPLVIDDDGFPLDPPVIGPGGFPVARPVLRREIIPKIYDL